MKLYAILIMGLFLTIFIFRDDIIADIKDILNLKPEQYYGANIDMSLILPESKHYVVNSKGEDLIDIAAKLGINMFRITNIASSSDDKITPPYTFKQWAEVLNKMRRKGIYADILIESNASDKGFFVTELNGYYLNYVNKYIVDSNVCSFSNVLIVDIRNEPLLDQNNLNVLKSASKLVKSNCPTKQVTVGSWKLGNNWHDPKGASLLSNIVDIYAVHIYGFDKPVNNTYPDPYSLTTAYLNEVKKYTGNKPIIIEEFGAGNGSALTDQDTLGSQEIQKNTYEDVFKATRDFKYKGIIGAIAYVFLSRSALPDGWSFAKENGDILLPAAYTFKQN